MIADSLNEYIMVLVPHRDFQEKVNEIREAFREEFRVASNQPEPRLLIGRFSQLQVAENRIMGRLREICVALKPFRIEVNGSGSYPSHSIFLKVQTANPVLNLVKQFKAIQRILKYDEDHKPWFVTDPHIIIANKLQPWQYEQGWKKYKSLSFKGSFIADQVLLLRRTGNRFIDVERFHFRDYAVETQQGSLF